MITPETRRPGTRPAILDHLRTATQEEHDAIENLLRLDSPNISLRRYVSVLVKFAGFYKVLEERLQDLEGWERYGLNLEDRLKSEALTRDLAHFCLKPEEVDAASTVPQLSNLAEGFGALYVIEGASLGGQVISRNAQTSLGLHADQGVAFFGGYGEQTGTMWRSFWTAMESFEARNGGAEEMVKAARLTFSGLRLWCDGLPD